MNKLLVLLSATLFLSNCAGNPSDSEALPPDTNAGPAQVTAASKPAHTDASPDAGIADNNPELASMNSNMEEVEVEGFKEKKYCTTEKRTGSRIPTRYCRTVSEDKQQKEAARSWLNTIKNRPQGVDGQKG